MIAPTPVAKVVRLAKRRRPDEADVDLSDREQPSDVAGLRVHRSSRRDGARLSFLLRAWRLLHVGFQPDLPDDRGLGRPAVRRRPVRGDPRRGGRSGRGRPGGRAGRVRT
jgi:hypothetical protein